MRNIVNRALERAKTKQISLLTLLLLFTMGIGQMWADCEKGTLLFSMEVTSNPASKIQVAAKSGGVNGSLDLAANVNVTVVGTSAVMYNSNSSAYDAITTAGEICFKNTTKHWIEISFPCALAAGDKISFTTSKTNPIAFSGTASGTKYSTTNNKLEISTSETSELIGKTSLWIWRPGSEPNVKALRIIRPATITLDAATNGGTVSVTSIEGAIGDKVVLPHAFKSDNKFKGWYTAATEGTKRADYYTISGDETVVAQFEALPSTGEMFSLEMQESMKPAADISLDKGQQRDLLEFAIISGGAAIGANTTSSSNHFKITSAGKISFNGTAAYMIINLDFPLAAGDVIATDVSAKTWVTHLSSAPSSGPYVDGTNKSYTIKSTDANLIGATTLYLWRGSNATLSEISITRPLNRTITLEYADGTTADGSLLVVDGEKATKPADPTWAHHRFDGWYNGASAYDWNATVSSDLTLTAHWTQLYTVTYANGDEGATGDAPTQADKAEGETFKVAANTFELAGKVFDHWNDGTNDYDPDDTYTVGTSDVTLTAVWRTPSTMYAITEGTHTNGSITIDPVEQEEGEIVTLEATPDEDYLFSAWDVYKTGESSTKVTVTSNTFTMPAYAVTVDATFVADERQKVLYVTSTAEATVKANDKLYDALKDIYNVKIVGPTSDADQSGYALVVLHESIGGGNYGATAVAAAKTGNTPVLNTKSYFYNNANTTDQRWNWGTPNVGQSVKGATLNNAYCNIADHPLFSGVTVTDGFFEITDDAAAKCMQPVGSFTSGKEGYTLATTPNEESGNGCAIHELTPEQRGASAGKYLLISVSNGKLNALNANGQKLFQNAAAYLIGSTAWEPISALTSAEVAASPSSAYSVGDNIALTASATGVSDATTYTWYKGETWAAAEEAGAIQVAKTAAEDGDKYGIAGCALADAGTYWCVISNGIDCETKASLAITVSDISYNIAFVSAHGTAPSATTGVSYTLPKLTASGWAHQGWTASIDVTVDEATVTAGDLIANGKIAIFGADVKFTAVWKQEFQVSFNLKGHGDPIAPQVVVDGELATEPDAPFEIGQIFGGWFTDENCTEGNEFNFSTPITDNTPLYAQWTAFDGCVELWPATSGSAPAAVGDAIVMQTGSKGAAMTVAAKPERLTYTAYGLQFGNESGVKVKVVLNNDMTVGTKISLTLVSGGTGARGLHLYNADGSAKITSLGWSSATSGAEETFTYTVVAEDGLDGTNAFQLWRNNTVILKTLKVESCGAAVIYHGLTSAITPDHDPAYATVTLGASSVREGLTTTATYSDIDEAYEFDTWLISGTGASIADASANPAVITMGTADAVVTLKLKAATPKHTVSYNVMGHGDAPASEQVKEGAKVTKPADPTADNWAFCGWYKESTLENAWDFAVDVMGTSDIELFAKWEDETGAIKLIDKSTGAINTTNFITAVTAKDDVNGEKGAEYTSARTALNSISALGEMVQYNATTNKAKIKLEFYNTSTSAKVAYLFKLEEGSETADVIEIPLEGSSPKVTEYYSFDSEKNRSFYVTVSDKKVQISQIKVMDNGTVTLKQFGQVGYSLNLNKGRLFAKSGNETSFEGITLTTSSDYKILNNSNLATKSANSFSIAASAIMSVKRSGGKYYVYQDPEDKGTLYSSDADIELNATGTWYISSENSGSAVSFTNIAFSAPKCAEPAFNELANSDICSGDPYVALDGTATVADAAITGSISYQWYKGDNTLIVGEESATYTPSEDGSYYVIATNHRDGYSDNTKKSETVTVATVAGTVINAGPANVRDDAGESATLTVDASGKNLHYAWKECATIDGTYTDVAGADDAASLVVTVPTGVKYYKVVVSSACGADAEAIAKVEEWVEVSQVSVSENTSWDFTTCADAEIKLTDATTPKKGEEYLMANIRGVHYDDPAFNAQALIFAGEYIYRNVTGKPLGAIKLKFTTTVDGFVTVRFADNGNNNRCLRVTDSEGVEFSQSSASNSDIQEFTTFVHAGDIEIMGVKEDHTGENQYVRIFNLAFEKVDYSREVNAGRYGTICLPKAGVMVGASIYEVAYFNEERNKLYFDEVLNGEMEAGKPYLFLPNENVATIGVYYTDEDAVAVAGDYRGFYGTFELIESGLNEAGIYLLSNNQILHSTNTNSRLQANRAYLKIGVEGGVPTTEPAVPHGRRRISMGVQGENAATAIDELNAAEVPVKMIIDGQLFILRGEKMYDATGKLVK